MFPDRSREILFHRENALRFIKEQNFEMARMSFMKWVESVKQQNANTNGALESQLKEAQSAYSEFVKGDPLFIDTCAAIFPLIQKSPGILQTELYKRCPQIDKGNISYALYFAADHGKIGRTKKGRTYMLSMLE